MCNLLVKLSKQPINWEYKLVPWEVGMVDKQTSSEHPCTLTDLAMHGSERAWMFPLPWLPPHPIDNSSVVITPVEKGELANRLPSFPILKTGGAGEYKEK